MVNSDEPYKNLKWLAKPWKFALGNGIEGGGNFWNENMFLFGWHSSQGKEKGGYEN